VVDTRAEYIWTLPEVGAAGPTGGDDGLGGYMPLAVVVGVPATAELRWVHSHHNGAPIMMTSTTGVAIAHGDHAVMGFPGQFANARQLAGAQHYYNRYRDYNPITGRYIQADPIGLAGDANPFAYAMGNALRYNDPTGEFVPVLVGLAIKGALIGAGSDLAFQAAGNILQGRAVFDHNCYDWGQVAISAGLGALGVRPGTLAANPFKGKTAPQIARMLESRGFLPRGPNPAVGRGNFVNPRTGRGYHIDANHPPPKGPHVGVHRPRGARGALPSRDYPL
jgi:RHS repeat-associated protein